MANQSPTSGVETAADFGDDEGALAKRWITEIGLFEDERKKFIERGKKILKRYRDERDIENDERRRFAMLWSNTEVLKPTLYARPPKAEVQRRFKDRDPVARVASEIAERCLDYMIDCDSRFDAVIRECVQDVLLPGIGVIWQRYVPIMGTETLPDGSQIETVTGGKVEDDYVYWEDFGHNPGARTWEEIYAVWRKAYMTRDELHARFDKTLGADEVNQIPLDYSPKNVDKAEVMHEMFKKACVYEIWDKSSKRAIWVSKTYPTKALDTRDDPLKLTGFFPCPKPLYATMINGDMTPIPDFAFYQDQADEIDNMTDRIARLQKSLRIRGLYAGDVNELRRMLEEGGDNDMIPIENWQPLADKGGIEKAITYFPVHVVAKTILDLMAVRDKAKQDLYEVTGLSDIIRGATDPDETLGAQQLKAQWGSRRIRERQEAVKKFVRDTLRIKAEIAFNLFPPQALLEMSNAQSLGPDAEVAPKAIELLKSNSRGFRIDIETDSTIQPDENEEKRQRTEFLTAMASFMKEALPLAQQTPAIAPMLGEMLMFGVRSYRVGDTLEGAIEKAMESLAQTAKPQGPDPLDVAKIETERAKVQVSAQESAAKDKNEKARLMLDAMKMGNDAAKPEPMGPMQ